MKLNPEKIYLVRGRTLAGFEEALRRRTPIPSDSDTLYSGPNGFTLPRGSSRTDSPFRVSVTGGEVFVSPGLILPSEYYPELPGPQGVTEPFGVPRATFGGPRLDELPTPSCGEAPSFGTTIVHLVFRCLVSSNPVEGFVTGGQVVDAWIQLSEIRLPWREGAGDQWFFRIPIGRASNTQAVSLLNTNIQPGFRGPVTNAPEVPPAAPEILPTLSILYPIGQGI